MGQRLKNPMSNLTKKKNKGFTLLEVIIAIFIFALSAVAVMQIFAGSMSGYREAKNTQRNLEDAQFIMNQIAKTLRTSSIVFPTILSHSTSSNVKVYDYSSGKCWAYLFDNGSSRIKSDSDSVPAASLGDPISYCKGFSPTYTSMTDFYTTGSFYVYPSNNDPAGSGEQLGRVTIQMNVCPGVSSCSHPERIQTSVSLRDYYRSGI